MSTLLTIFLTHDEFVSRQPRGTSVLDPCLEASLGTNILAIKQSKAIADVTYMTQRRFAGVSCHLPKMDCGQKTQISTCPLSKCAWGF